LRSNARTDSLAVPRSGPLGRLCADIQLKRRETTAALRDPEIHWDVFPGLPGTSGAGAPWSAVVKGDVDRDLTGGPVADEECLFLEQRTLQDVDGIGAAVRDMAELLVAQPVG